MRIVFISTDLRTRECDLVALRLRGTGDPREGDLVSRHHQGGLSAGDGARAAAAGRERPNRSIGHPNLGGVLGGVTGTQVGFPTVEASATARTRGAQTGKGRCTVNRGLEAIATSTAPSRDR